MYRTLFTVSVLLLGIHCAEQSKFSIFQKGCDMEKCELDVGKVDTNSMCCLHAGRYPAGGLV